MDMTTDDRLWDILAAWESAYRQGNDQPAEQLCLDCPELLPEVRANIHALKNMDRFLRRTEEEPGKVTEPPFSLGEYTVLEKIGSGGMGGTVYKAQHRRMDRIVALKILPKTAISAELLDRFEQEVKAAAKLSHANIVIAHDAGEQDGYLYLAMELVDGSDLHRHVKLHGPLPVAKAVEYTLQAATGLEYAHGNGVHHFDVKPGNMILAPDGTIKVLDLGLARLKRPGATPEHEFLAGTVDYLAPERTAEPEQSDQRSDIYSLGCTLYFLLTGKPVYEAKSVVHGLLAHREYPIPSLRQTRPDASTDLDAVFQRMVAKRPADRYQSMTDVIDALRNCLRDEARHTKRRRLLLAGLGLAVIAGVASSLAHHGEPNPKGAILAAPKNELADRQAAEWVLGIDGKVTVKSADGATVNLSSKGKLPDQPLTVQMIDVRGISQVTDANLEQIAALHSLENLNLDKTPITDKGIEHLKGLKNLHILRLNGTGLTDDGMANLAGLTELQMLELSGTAVSDPSLRHVEKMQKLTWLMLTDTKITDAGLQHLAALTNLRDLRLARLGITDGGLKHLAELKELRTLELFETLVSDGCLKHLSRMKNLAWLNLVRTRITDAGVDDLGQFQSLRQLNLDGTKVTAEGIGRLQAALPTCKITK